MWNHLHSFGAVFYNLCLPISVLIISIRNSLIIMFRVRGPLLSFTQIYFGGIREKFLCRDERYSGWHGQGKLDSSIEGSRFHSRWWHGGFPGLLKAYWWWNPPRYFPGFFFLFSMIVLSWNRRANDRIGESQLFRERTLFV